MASLTPELQAALAAQIEYYRDLGIFDLYRRAGDGQVVDVIASTAPADPAPFRETPIRESHTPEETTHRSP